MGTISDAYPGQSLIASGWTPPGGLDAWFERHLPQTLRVLELGYKPITPADVTDVEFDSFIDALGNL